MTHMPFHRFTKKEEKKPEQQDQPKRVLNWFLFFWLGFIYVQYVLPRIPSLLQEKDEKFSPVLSVGDLLQKESRSAVILALVIFTLLMVFHSGLHWLVLFGNINNRNIRRRYLWFYFPLQTVCIWLIYLMTDGRGGPDNALSGLCFILAIEAIVLFKRISLIIVAATGCLLFYITIQGLGLRSLPTQLSLYMEPKLIALLTNSTYLIPFVCVCVILYIQQTRAHQRDQKLLRELEAAHIQLEDYAVRVQELTLTTERQRMARELHDTLAQGLVGLTMQLEAIDSLLIEQGYEQAHTIVRQAMTRSRATITSARAAITDLRAEPASSSDILAAIENETRHFTLATGIPCTCALQTELPGEHHEHLLRMVSEGLANIARHAQASQVWVQTRVENTMITFDIEDNGIGFDPAQVTAGHYGLQGMRERARLMNGHLLINSEPGQGTTVRLCLPCREQVCL